MNARLYDPITSLSLSPDNYVADADATQAYNRYSYCLNNPMKYTDPDGNLPILVVLAVVGGTFNMISNFDKITQDPWSAVGYFASGAIGGMVSLTNPLAGGAITTNMNIITDIAFGNVPEISSTSDAVSYLGFKVLEGVGAAGTGQLVKGVFNFIGKTSWLNTTTLTGVAHYTVPGTSILQGVTGPTVGIAAAQKITTTPVWSAVAKGVVNAGKFSGDEAVVHFGKHGKSVMDAIGKSTYNLKNYVEDANFIIKNGTFVPELNGYVRLIGGTGSAKFGFVGLSKSTGNITTFHIKTAKELAKKASSLFVY